MTSEPQAVEFRAAAGVRLRPSDWEARATAIKNQLAEDELPTSDLTDVLGSFRLLDDGGKTWTYNGDVWFAWDGQTWTAGEPGPSLQLQPFTLDVLPNVDEKPPLGVDAIDDDPRDAEPVPDALPADAEPVWVATHTAPDGGMRTWAEPDAGGAVTAPLDPCLPVQVTERLGAWARIVCSNGWSAWVDGRELHEIPSVRGEQRGGTIWGAPLGPPA